jgi:hypothetical protein
MPRATRNDKGGAVAEHQPETAAAEGTPAAATATRREPPSTEAIARRAYEIYRERGGTEGQEIEDWLRAEAELRDEPGRRDDEL